MDTFGPRLLREIYRTATPTENGVFRLFGGKNKSASRRRGRCCLGRRLTGFFLFEGDCGQQPPYREPEYNDTFRSGINLAFENGVTLSFAQWPEDEYCSVTAWGPDGEVLTMTREEAVRSMQAPVAHPGEVLFG